MSALRRLARVLWVLSRYRLDAVIDTDQLRNAQIPRRYLWLLRLSPMRLFPIGNDSRGRRLRLALEQLGPVFIKLPQNFHPISRNPQLFFRLPQGGLTQVGVPLFAHTSGKGDLPFMSGHLLATLGEQETRLSLTLENTDQYGGFGAGCYLYPSGVIVRFTHRRRRSRCGHYRRR